MKKVLVFELNNYHTETFPVYENLLPSLLGEKVDIDYYVMAKKYDDMRGVYPSTHLLCGQQMFFLVRHLQLRVPFFVRRINAIIREQQPDLVVFNSIEPERYYRVFKKINAPKKLGLIHNPKKSTATKEANECYFVLSPLLYENFKESVPLDGYLLPYFRQFDFPPKAENGIITVAVQGLISYKRRDYHFLVEAAGMMAKKGISHVHFNIIGSTKIQDGPAFVELVKRSGVAEYFSFYDELDDREFFEQVNASDCIMTLLHENQRQYYTEKTTASLSHAAAYNKPLILCRANAEAWSVDEESALVYEGVADFVEMIVSKERLQKAAEGHQNRIAAAIEANRQLLEKVEC